MNVRSLGWDASDIPPAKNVMMFKFLNRTNGKYSDAQVFWSFKSKTIDEVHSFAEQPLYDMPANASGRMYFYLEAPDSKYSDFVEFTIGRHFSARGCYGGYVLARGQATEPRASER